MFTEDLEKLVRDHPVYRQIIPKLYELEMEHPDADDCWEKPDWLAPNHVTMMKRRGILKEEKRLLQAPDPIFAGATQLQEIKVYKVVDVMTMVDFITEEETEEEPPDWESPTVFDPDELFADYIRNQDRDRIITEIIEAIMYPGSRQHILLDGPKASGKTVILDAIMTLEHTLKVNGGTTSAVGFIEALDENPRTRIAVADEFEKWFWDTKKAGEARGVILPYLEEGIINVHKHKNHKATLNLGVFIAAINNRGPLEMDDGELLSRFDGGIYTFSEYTEEEFTDLCLFKFGRAPWNLDPDLIEVIREEVWTFNKDVRTARGLAKSALLAAGRGLDPIQRVKEKMQTMRDFAQPTESCPSCGRAM